MQLQNNTAAGSTTAKQLGFIYTEAHLQNA